MQPKDHKILSISKCIYKIVKEHINLNQKVPMSKRSTSIHNNDENRHKNKYNQVKQK
jgi:hypothetical protein